MASSNNIKPTKYPMNPNDLSGLFDQAVTAGREGKQDTLVSRTNIKTVNGGSLLGSGDLSITASVTWGGITGTLSSQTDLNTALNGKEPSITAGTTAQYYRGDKTFQALNKSAVELGNVDNTSDANKPVSTATSTALSNKQDTLVSGTNIKTVNGGSLLGSGDVTTNPRTLASVNGSNLTGTANQISASVLIPANTLVTNNTIYIKGFLTKTSGSSTSTPRIYINTTNSLSGATLLATALSMTSTNYFGRLERNFFFNGTNLNFYNSGSATNNDNTTGAMTLFAFNPATAYYLIFAIQNTSTTPDNLGWNRTIVQIYD
jgi:hypothetical protein